MISLISLDEAAVVYNLTVIMQQDMTNIKQQMALKKVKYQFVFDQILYYRKRKPNI